MHVTVSPPRKSPHRKAKPSCVGTLCKRGREDPVGSCPAPLGPEVAKPRGSEFTARGRGADCAKFLDPFCEPGILDDWAGPRFFGNSNSAERVFSVGSHTRCRGGELVPASLALGRRPLTTSDSEARGSEAPSPAASTARTATFTPVGRGPQLPPRQARVWEFENAGEGRKSKPGTRFQNPLVPPTPHRAQRAQRWAWRAGAGRTPSASAHAPRAFRGFDAH